VPHTPLTIPFSEPCWRFLSSVEDTELLHLSPELRAVLQRPPLIQVTLPDPLPRYAIELQRLQAYELLEFLARTYEVLPKDDDRRQVCQQCLTDIEDAIIRARAS
jgi:hypothetical protein